MSCSIDSCDRDIKARGWCGTHYRRWLDTGDTRPDEPIRALRRGEGCNVNGCDRQYWARGWCKGHYQRWYKNGEVRPNEPIDRRKSFLGLRQWLYEGAKRSPCLDCGVQHDPFVMDLDHVWGEKEKHVSRMVYSSYNIDDVVWEIAKCEPVCANCHRYRTLDRNA